MTRRYAIVSALYAPHRGGVETFTQSMAHELVRGGDEVVIVTSRLSDSDQPHERQEDGVEVWRLPCNPLMGGRLPIPLRNREFRMVEEQLAQEHFDGVLVNTRFYGMSLEGVRLARRASAPSIVLDHGSSWITLGNAAADAVLRVYERWMTARLRRYHPTFAGVSKKSIQWLRTFGINTTLEIPNAIDAEEFRSSTSRRDFRGELDIAPSQKLIAFVARLEPEKGPMHLVSALAELGDGYVGVIAGEGSLRGEIEAMGLSNVHLIGNISHEDVSALLSQADAMCLPSRSEGFCLSVLEAAAWGVPIAVTDVGVVREALGDCWVEIKEPYADLALRLSEAIQLDASETRTFVEQKYSWQNAAACLRRAFEALRPDGD